MKTRESGYTRVYKRTTQAQTYEGYIQNEKLRTKATSIEQGHLRLRIKFNETHGFVKEKWQEIKHFRIVSEKDLAAEALAERTAKQKKKAAKKSKPGTPTTNTLFPL